MGLYRIAKGIGGAGIRRSELHYSPVNVGEFRPMDSYVSSGYDDAGRVPYYPIGLDAVYDMFYNSPTLRLIIVKLKQEVFRNGFWVKPKFKHKCAKCGFEFNDDLEKCPVCGSTKFVEPDYKEKISIEKWMPLVNGNLQSFKDVMEDIYVDLLLFDNAYLVVRKDYEYDKEGRIIDSFPKEMLRASPLVMTLVMNKNFRFGRDDENKIVAFCPEHRDKVYYITEADWLAGKNKCPICGKKLVPAYFEAKSGDQKVFYTKGEVFHVKKFSTGAGYGYPPVFTVWTQLMILLKMDLFVLAAYKLQRSPYGLLFVKGHEEDVMRAWKLASEEARKNPYAIVPIAVPDAVGENKFVEYIDLSYKADDIDFTQYRNEIRNQVGMLYGVSPMMQGDRSVGAGLNNEGLEITITNRQIDYDQDIFNEKIFPWVAEQYHWSDWNIQLVHNEEKDMMAKLQRELARIRKAQEMMTLGYKPKLVEKDDGIDFEFEYTGEIINVGSRARPNIADYTGNLEGTPDSKKVNSRDAEFSGSPENPRKTRSDKKDDFLPDSGE